MAEESIAIVGAGAMGGVFGALLAESGADVTLLDPDARLVDAVNARGVTLLESGGERNVRIAATTDPGSLREPSVAIFFVKCHHTKAAAESVRPALGPDATVVSLQNGWGNADVLAGLFGVERLVLGVTYTSATTVEPGMIRTSGAARTVLGALDGGQARVTSIERALRKAGFATELPDRVLDEIWKKLVLNAATLPTAALTGLTAGALVSTDEMRQLVDTAAAEAVAVGRAQGFDVSVDERLQSIHAVLEAAGSGKASMLQDVEAGRPTEIDVISGAVLRKAQEHDIDTPATRALYALVTGLEKARNQR
ncbi:MAG TPA: 2-dehydropantoate 2-reductase [Solirubrobacteraceae bacterium]|nr:2-dehydropantoate 2-reductase [Solirubrobacteraceae bacterium]